MMRKLAYTMAVIAIALPMDAAALGLGNIEVRSKLNEPLKADIDLLSVSPSEIEDIRVQLAAPEDFERAGVERPYLLSRLRFRVMEGPKGKVQIHVTSTQPIREPFLNFLLEVNWPKGRLLREYTVLLDPPVYAPEATTAMKRPVAAPEAQPAPAPVPKPMRPVATAPTPAPPAPKPVPMQEAHASTSSPAPAPAPQAMPEKATAHPAVPAPKPLPRLARPAGGPVLTPESYGPTAKADTLWSIANRVRPDSVSNNQMMLALLRANPEAFDRQNVNALKTGVVLRIPKEADMVTVSQAEALEEVKRQHAVWDEYRQQVASRAGPAVEGAMAETTAPAKMAAGTAAGESAIGADESDARLELLSAGSGQAALGGVSGGGADVAALHQELAVVMEDLDSKRLENEDLAARLKEAETLIADLQRLIQLKDDNLAALQAQLAARKGPVTEAAPRAGLPEPEPAPVAAKPPAEPEPVSEPEPVVKPEPMMSAPGEEKASTPKDHTAQAPVEVPPALTPVEAVPAPAPAQPERVAQAAAPGPAPAAVPAPKPAPAAKPAPRPKPILPPPPAPESKSLMDTVLALVPSVDPMMAGGGLGAALLIVVFVMVLMRRRAVRPAGIPLVADEDLTDEELGMEADEDQTEPTHPQPENSRAKAEPTKAATPIEEQTMIAGPGAFTPEEPKEEDPLAEVNVYLAYERFDQAARLVRDAIANYPDRQEYKLKLLEVHFAAKDAESFEGDALALRDAVGEKSEFWRQAQAWWQELSPGRAMFAAAVGTAATTTAASSPQTSAEAEEAALADDFESTVAALRGEDRVNFEEARAQAAAEIAAGEIDFDLGLTSEAGGEEDDAGEVDFGFELEGTGEVGGTPETSDAGLDFELPAEETEEPEETRDSNVVDFDLGLDSLGADDAAARATGADDAQDDESTVDFDLSSLEEEAGTAANQTRAGLDVAFATDESEGAFHETGPILDLGGESEMGAEEQADDAAQGGVELGLADERGEGPGELRFDTDAVEGEGDETSALELEPTEQGLEILGLEAEAGEQGAAEGEEEFDLEFGADGGDIDEVGTKLDLAQAYVDMGDSDGARGILNEVIQEGSDTQKEEAQALLARLG
jgi:pilus assembly protein FimV